MCTCVCTGAGACVWVCTRNACTRVHVCTCIHVCTLASDLCVCACMHTCVIRDTLTENKAGETLEEDAEDEDDADEEDLRTLGERAKASCETGPGASRAC